MEQQTIYDDYHDRAYSQSQVVEYLDKYLQWCETNNQEPEVTTLEEINEQNIGHVVYHAELV